MPSPSVTNTFANSTTADASQVNTNFTDIISGMSDGTKDLSISALTCAGALTANGNVNLGNASGDDLTITASLASTIAIKTTFSYDIGSATIGLRSLYLGASDSSARSARILAGAVSASYSITLPTAVAAQNSSVLTFDTSGIASFEPKSKIAVSGSKTSNYTATAADTLILCDSTSAFTVTLPAAASSTGKTLIIKKTTSDFNAVTIDGNASETIDGATTTTINTQYESLEIACDGSNWHIVRRMIPGVWTSYSMTITGSSSNPTKATAADIDSAVWRRVGDSVEIMYTYYDSNASGAAGGSGAYLFALPTGLTIDTTKAPASTTEGRGAVVGSAGGNQNGPACRAGIVQVYSSTKLAITGGTATSDPQFVGSAWFTISNTDQAYSFRAVVPISGWTG